MKKGQNVSFKELKNEKERVDSPVLGKCHTTLWLLQPNQLVYVVIFVK